MRHDSSLIIVDYNARTRILLCVWSLDNRVLGNSKPKNSWQDFNITGAEDFVANVYWAKITRSTVDFRHGRQSTFDKVDRVEFIRLCRQFLPAITAIN